MSSDPKSILQGMVALAFVQSDLLSSLQVAIQQPAKDEDRPHKFADLAQGFGDCIACPSSGFLGAIAAWIKREPGSSVCYVRRPHFGIANAAV